MFDHTPPPPFNPDYDPDYMKKLLAVADSMEKDGYYDTHTLEECALEVSRRLQQQENSND